MLSLIIITISMYSVFVISFPLNKKYMKKIIPLILLLLKITTQTNLSPFRPMDPELDFPEEINEFEVQSLYSEMKKITPQQFKDLKRMKMPSIIKLVPLTDNERILIHKMLSDLRHFWKNQHVKSFTECQQLFKGFYSLYLETHFIVYPLRNDCLLVKSKVEAFMLTYDVLIQDILEITIISCFEFRNLAIGC